MVFRWSEIAFLHKRCLVYASKQVSDVYCRGLVACPSWTITPNQTDITMKKILVYVSHLCIIWGYRDKFSTSVISVFSFFKVFVSWSFYNAAFTKSFIQLQTCENYPWDGYSVEQRCFKQTDTGIDRRSFSYYLISNCQAIVMTTGQWNPNIQHVTSLIWLFYTISCLIRSNGNNAVVGYKLLSVMCCLSTGTCNESECLKYLQGSVFQVCLNWDWLVF